MRYAELHRHLDISIRLATLHELAIEQGRIPQSTSLKSFQDEFVLRAPLKNLEEVLSKFTLFQDVLQTPEICQRVGRECMEDCLAEGASMAELRFAPGFAAEKSGLDWKEITEAFHRGIQETLTKYPMARGGLICIVVRDHGLDAAAKTVDFFLKNQNHFIALDLAGNEDGFPCRQFQEVFRPAREAGAKLTIHSGEATGPENVWEAIELLGAHRIGHGVRSLEDPKLVRYLAEKEICLEVCPTSNWLTQACDSWENHQLAALHRAGVPTCINTDDPTIFGTTLPQEYRIAEEKLGLSSSEITTIQENSLRFSFLSSTQ